jgi:hypothetical protein
LTAETSDTQTEPVTPKERAKEAPEEKPKSKRPPQEELPIKPDLDTAGGRQENGGTQETNADEAAPVSTSDSPKGESPNAAKVSEQSPPDLTIETIGKDGNDDAQFVLEARVAKLEQLLQDQADKEEETAAPKSIGITIAAGIMMVAAIIVFFWLRPDKKLRSEWSSLLESIRAEEDANKDALSDPALFSLIGSVGTALFTLVTLSWLFLGALPIVVALFDTTASGTFGDTFGFINSWFSGLALGGVVIAILMQTMELRYQRKELRETKEQLRKSAEAADSSQEQLTKQTYLSFLATYLGALEAVAKSSPDAEGSPGRVRDAANVSRKLNTLLFRLERDSLGIGLVAEAEQDEVVAQRLNWNTRFRELQESLSQHWATKRKNNGGAVGQAQELLKVANQQLLDLRQEADGVRVEKLLTSMDDVRRRLQELIGFRFKENNTIVHTGGRPVSRRDAEYTEFWTKGGEVIERFRAIVEAVQTGAYNESSP